MRRRVFETDDAERATTRVQLEMPPQAMVRLQKLKERTEAASYAEVIRNALRLFEPYDVILCDLMMPVMTGMDLYAELAATRPALAARMIFMTGGTFTARARDFLAAVPNPAIDKPFDLSALSALLRARVGHRA